VSDDLRNYVRSPSTRRAYIPAYAINASLTRIMTRIARAHRSRNVRAAPRFSPTRFIPLVAPAGIITELDYAHALGIKRYTLGASELDEGKDNTYA
ncbi:MAG: hypothetical protein Q7J56_03940, partial [Deltaproteobacteria bacterium]|nr:hypothetical protein [Deltaproteobacteria bacterium]